MKFNATGYKKIFLVGIKGSGMTALAIILNNLGMKVSGIDSPEVFFTDKVLARHHIKVTDNFSEAAVSGVDLAIYSTAYEKTDNQAMRYFREQGIPLMSYPEFLGSLMEGQETVAVSGTHGKTTTTALLGFLLQQGGISPSVIVGSNVPQFDGNALVGKSNKLIVEADEYQNKFKYYHPRYVILNNIDWDHPDFFPSFEDYQRVFKDFVEKLSSDGVLIANNDDPQVVSLLGFSSAPVITFGLGEGADWQARPLGQDENFQYYDIFYHQQHWLSAKLRLFGDFNILNSLAAIAMAIKLGVSKKDISVGLKNFKGTERRFEFKGEYRGTLLFDDFAHHPAEIKATLIMARKRFPQNRLMVVFHPHTFSRTEKLFSDFSSCFSKADKVIVLDIYSSARESAGNISSRDLVEAINKLGGRAIYQSCPEKAADFLRLNAVAGDVIITMGAGDVWRVANLLLS